MPNFLTASRREDHQHVHNPREIVTNWTGQTSSASRIGKRAVAIALRNRWRRQQLPEAPGALK